MIPLFYSEECQITHFCKISEIFDIFHFFSIFTNDIYMFYPPKCSSLTTDYSLYELITFHGIIQCQITHFSEIFDFS